MNEQMQSRIEQARTELQAGTTNKNITNRFAAEWNVSSRTVERMIRMAQAELADERRVIREKREQVLEEHSAELAEQEIKDMKEINALLMEIIRGKTRATKVFYTNPGLEEREVLPDIKERTRAAEVYLKRAGARAIEKQRKNEKEANNRDGEAAIRQLADVFMEEEEEREFEIETSLEREGKSERERVPEERRETNSERETERERVNEEEREDENKIEEKSQPVINEPVQKDSLGQTSTFNKWAIPFMPSRSGSYARRGGSRIKNFPVR